MNCKTYREYGKQNIKTDNKGGMLTTRIKYDVMLNDRFYATLTSTIPYKIYENGGG